MALDQIKMINQIRKAQKQLEKEIIEVVAGDGAVTIRFSGDLKVKGVSIDPTKIDLDEVSDLEHWVEIAIRDGLAEAQKIAAEKMKPFMGGLGNLGL